MNRYSGLISDFTAIVGEENILLNEPMSRHISFKVGGPADILLTPENNEAVQQVIKICSSNNIPYFIMGNGSNLIVKDGGFRGVVIKLVKLDSIKVEDNKIICGSGALLSDVSDKALKSSLTGFEFACGIPGCIGGAVAMNAGAYISEIKNVLESALIVDRQGDIKRLSNEQMEFGYRNSYVLKNSCTVLEAVFSFEHGEYSKIKELIDDFQNRRSNKQPLEYPSAGSTFKRPEGYYTGKLIEDCNLKGYCVGGAQVSEKHSGFIINKKNATAMDILRLIEHVQKIVHECYGVELKTEVRIIGEDAV
ncbi:UDP-N-acetylmuramate dehydrogenase [Clostridium sp. 19966]|uniref:UDP-N-acetylmuramate dehydrogenase n=1 Tax=Clostridium sp. 19966 TaxID=2768166 RepID=UPI0028DF4B89|nr:UDP-N-acetylmuramate dehydrogenase [Clostridium sp. 19966]MDT8716093.1 UDP-N-acetylmuramate dehydrogenase [Clostridium sp. 19966]